MEPKRPKPIVEESEECMVSVIGGKPTLRRARFLQPSVSSAEKAMEVPHVQPLLSETSSFKSVETWPLKVQFSGWKAPQRKWKQWVDKMVQIHEPIWRKVCIYEAIMASTYDVRKNEYLVFGLVELWCSETNTFVFPWGEATITLEDMLILEGFSVLGESVTSPLDESLLEIKNRINEEWHGFSKLKALKPACSSWINHFMEMNDTDRNLEHVAFLVLWLSRYVFPRHRIDIVGKHAFSIAIHLAQGIRIALAPAVLSSLYRDLGLLNRSVIACNDIIEVWAPFHLLKMWVWEHFPLLRPKQVNSLHECEPRVARWHKLCTNAELQFVRYVLKVSGNFRWRCYTEDVINWRHPSFYKEKEMWVVYNSYIDDDLRSFARCLRACVLVGLRCIEQYLPHRVAMQFGLDQDLSGYFTRANSSWEDAWITYDKSIKKAKFYIPPRLFVSDVTTRYLDWWKESMRHRKTPENMLHQERSMCSENEDQEEHYGSVPPKCKKLKLQAKVNHKNCSSDEEDEMTLAQRFGLSRNPTEVIDSTSDPPDMPSSSTHSRTSLPSMIRTDMGTNRWSSTTVTEKNVSRNRTGVVSLAIGMDKPFSSTRSPTALPSAILTDMEANRRSSTMVTEKNVSNKGSTNGVPGENNKQINEEANTSRTDQDTELENPLENRVLKLEKVFAKFKVIKDILMAKIHQEQKSC